LLVMGQVRKVNRSGTAVIWVTQRLEELDCDDRMIAMAGGTIQFEGSTDDWFSRSSAGAGDSISEKLGFEAPYAVQVAWEMERLGAALSRPFPFTPEMLVEAVMRRG